MPIDAGYTWNDAKHPSLSTDPVDRPLLRWWTTLAVLLSVLLHIVLIILCDVIKLDEWSGKVDPTQRILAFKTSRVTIDKSLLDEIAIEPEEAEPEEPREIKIDQTPLVDKTLDEYELQELLAEKEVQLTPRVEEATRVLASETPTVRKSQVNSPNFDQVEGAKSESLDIEMKAMKSRLLEAARASDYQPTLELADIAADPKEADNYLHEGAKALTRGTQNTAITDGFSNLNDLLSQTGPLSDNTKPILIPTDLLFEYDSYDLREQAKLSLMRLGILIQRNPDSIFVIEGHTDSFGNDEYNMRLSVQRANVVRHWLVNALRIQAGNIRTVGFGESRPLMNPNGSVEEQALNRRVEISINKKPPGI